MTVSVAIILIGIRRDNGRVWIAFHPKEHNDYIPSSSERERSAKGFRVQMMRCRFEAGWHWHQKNKEKPKYIKK
jgi:hypothetical protein